MEVYDSRKSATWILKSSGNFWDLLALSEKSRKIWTYSVEQPVQASQNWQTDQSGLLASMLKNDAPLRTDCGVKAK